MAVALVQRSNTVQTAGSTSMTVTLSTTTAGNLLTLSGVEFDNILLSAVSGLGTWQKMGNTASSTIGTLEQWCCLANMGGTTVSLTLASTPGTTRGSYQVTEWSGGPWYQGAFAATSNAASSVTEISPSIIPTSAGALVIAQTAGSNPVTVPPNTSGWTDDTAADGVSWWNNSYQVCDWAYIVDATTAAKQCTWTQSTASVYSTSIATYLTSPVSSMPPLVRLQAVNRASSY